jgi:hypothetical protein
MQLLTHRRPITQGRARLEIQFVQGLEFGVPESEVEEEEEEEEADYFMDGPRTKVAVEEEDDDMTIRQFFDGRSIPEMSLSDDDAAVIRFNESVDMSGLTINLTHLFEEEEDGSEVE